MKLNWFQSLLFGLFSGLTDILPVSSQAHRLILLKLFGESSEPALLRLMVHVGTLAALCFACKPHFIRMMRAYRLSKIPKRRRKRPLDIHSLMDLSLIKTTLIPVILALLFYNKAASLGSNLMWIAGFLLLNGVILYIPRHLPGGNRDSRSMSRVEGLLLGLGGGISVLPGISCTGAVTSIGSACGVDRKFAFHIALVMYIPLTIGMIVYDTVALAGGAGELSFGILLGYVLAGGAAFGGTLLGVRLMQAVVGNIGFGAFAYYSWGLALLAFIFYLMAI